MAAMVCYGPLVDLSKAASHIGEYVQLLVLVHNIVPIQYKLWRKGGAAEVIRTDIQVGDNTREFFPVSIWQKQLASTVIAGDIILLQNVKITTTVGGIIEAKTVHLSALQCVVHSYKSLIASKGSVDELIRTCRIGVAAKDKLQKIVTWLNQWAVVELNSRRPINWKVYEDSKPQDCVSLRYLSNLSVSCKATVYASVGEVFLPITWRKLPESDVESMFISKRRLLLQSDCNLAEDLIAAGCQLCGTPFSSDSVKNSSSLYCEVSSDHLHVINTIYRPFMLYVWDDSAYVPLVVKDKAAQVLFGNIRAELVLSSYKRLKNGKNHTSTLVGPNGGKELKEKNEPVVGPNFYLVWLVLLKSLLQQEKNSPLKFEVTISATNSECERFLIVDYMDVHRNHFTVCEWAFSQ